ncbi:MAG: NUDIX domain-containing protein [Deinococcales bacterium]
MGWCGGGIEAGESAEAAIKREIFEEIGVRALGLEPHGQISFRFNHHPHWNMDVHLFNCLTWQGNPQESEEVAPKWFKTSEIPYKDNMWEDSRYWLPWLILGKKLKAEMLYGQDLRIVRAKVRLLEEDHKTKL